MKSEPVQGLLPGVNPLRQARSDALAKRLQDHGTIFLTEKVISRLRRQVGVTRSQLELAINDLCVQGRARVEANRGSVRIHADRNNDDA